ncbi:MAG: Extracellular esterase EstB precursor [Candidatus Heimdallarchaeota archaeon LC_3]|nr:MAG: Extracellular esterase EstB precursor [Candidatus Heimdallarchaeota archaeon LC_3]
MFRRKNKSEVGWEDLEQDFTEDQDIPDPSEIKDVDSKTRLAELDAHWLKISQKLNLWRYVANVGAHSRRHKNFEHFRPILLIHGYKSSHTTWNWLVRKLWVDGFHNIFAMELYDYQQGLKVNCNYLTKIMNEILNELVHEFKQLDIIGHSMGGIIGRYYLKFFDTKNRIRALFTMGSAHKGISKYVNLYIRLEGGKATARDLVSDGPLEQMNEIMSQQDLYSSTMVNIGGAMFRYRGGDGFVKLQPLSDMINLKVPVSHRKLNKTDKSYKIIQNLLLNKFWVYKIRLLYIQPDEKFPNVDYTFKVSTNTNMKFNYPAEGGIRTGINPYTPEVPVIIYSGYCKKKRNLRINLEIKYKTNTMKKFKKLIKKRKIIRFKKKKDNINYLEFNKRNKVKIQVAVYKYYLS